VGHRNEDDLSLFLPTAVHHSVGDSDVVVVNVLHAPGGWGDHNRGYLDAGRLELLEEVPLEGHGHL